MSTSEWIEFNGFAVKLEPDAEGRYTIYSPVGMKQLRAEEINPVILEEIEKATGKKFTRH